MSRTYLINGEEVRVNANWGANDKINSRSTLNIVVIDLLDLDKIDEGDSIEIIDNDGIAKIFSGIVQTKEIYEDTPGMLNYNITAVDNSARADKRLIAKVYENELAGDIAKDIINTVLTFEGVTIGDIEDGPIIKKAVFNYIKCSQALDYIKTVTGLNWNIDNENKLNLFNRSQYLAPVTLDDNLQHNNFRQKSSLDTYRNTQYIRGGKGKTATQANEIPSPKPDGSSRNFVLRYPLAEKPSIDINLNGAGWVTVNSDDIGVNGISTNKKWYFSYDNNVISQDETQTALLAVDSIRTTYKGLRNLFVKIDNPIQINNRIEAETGTSGIYENLAIEKSISDTGQAVEFAQGLIQTYGEITDRITFNTEISGFKAGQLLTVNKLLYGINDDFLIESINIKPNSPNSIIYTISALDGSAVGGWEEFFQKILDSNNDFVISGNEVIILLQNQQEIEGYQSSTDIKIINVIFPNDNLYPSESLTPGTIASEVVIND